MVTLKTQSLSYLSFYPVDVVSRYRGPQPQVGENYSYLFDIYVSTLISFQITDFSNMLIKQIKNDYSRA